MKKIYCIGDCGYFITINDNIVENIHEYIEENFPNWYKIDSERYCCPNCEVTIIEKNK